VSSISQTLLLIRIAVVRVLVLSSLVLGSVHVVAQDQAPTPAVTTLPTENDIAIIARSPQRVSDILVIDSVRVKPIDYAQVISLIALPLAQRKQCFIDLVLPGVLIAKFQTARELTRVQALAAQTTRTAGEQAYLDSMLKRYRARDIQDLEQRLLTPPSSIILAQASLETGWGTSRFFVQAGNIFGVWSFDPGEPRLATQGTRNGKHMYVRKYNSIAHSISDYLLTLARGTPYQAFRASLAVTDDPFELIKHLDNYSELGREYVRRLEQQIRHNHLERYDVYQLDSAYLQ